MSYAISPAASPLFLIPYVYGPSMYSQEKACDDAFELPPTYPREVSGPNFGINNEANMWRWSFLPFLLKLFCPLTSFSLPHRAKKIEAPPAGIHAKDAKQECLTSPPTYGDNFASQIAPFFKEEKGNGSVSLKLFFSLVYVLYQGEHFHAFGMGGGGHLFFSSFSSCQTGGRFPLF